MIEEDMGGKVSDHFAEFDREAFAAASIGQVHRARTLDGADVAVKVQYPGIAEAVEVDLRNLHLILRLAKRMAPGLDVKAVGGEIRERISEELDYELEAQSHRQLERAFRGHPFAVIPHVHTDLSTRRVLVSDFLDGTGFEAVKADGRGDPRQLRRGRLPLLHLLPRADPHGPRRPPPRQLPAARRRQGRVPRLRARPPGSRPSTWSASGRWPARSPTAAPGTSTRSPRSSATCPSPTSSTPRRCSTRSGPGASGSPSTGYRRLDPAYARELIELGGSPRSPHYEQMKRQTLPPASLLMRRQEGLILVVLADLEAGADWGRIAREYTFGDPPSTPKGEAEAAFWAR